ncbi:ras guanine nucleotide exchange factor domain-containing protein [Favolaschia claudopus]|uniref:Ras guanine nucleotide exchange factor domain-containing protein n=1 Tax=Favolaschia claudopus TaxID=2862362 RepID=A0AAW0D6F5_9AGAR
MPQAAAPGPSTSAFYRALYDCPTPQDPSCLPFRRNDVIEVLTKESSGWWDSLLGDKRGWVPSNFLVEISSAEAASTRSETKLDVHTSNHHGSDSDEPAPSELEGAGVDDFWMPELGSDGRIFYVNTETGQHVGELSDMDVVDMEAALWGGEFELQRPQRSSMPHVLDDNGERNVTIDLESKLDLLDDDQDVEPPAYEDVAFQAESPPPTASTYEGIDEILSDFPSAPPPTPQYVEHAPTEIIFDPDGGVRAGTARALVEHLTAHDRTDHNFVTAFLMTFKSFMSPDELFDHLVQRFWSQPAQNMNASEPQRRGQQKQRIIQIRVLNTFKSLLVDDGALELADGHVLDRVAEFITLPEVASLPAAAMLLTLIERTRRGESIVKMVALRQEVPPPPLVPRLTRNVELFDIDPLELARQFTIVDSHLFQKIRPVDCLHLIWDELGQSNNIDDLIQTVTKTSHWVQRSVLTETDFRRRAGIIEYFISVANHCRTLKNFSSMSAFVSGLSSPSVRRLKQTWAQVSRTSVALLDACEDIAEGDGLRLNYRKLIKSIVPPCVPFMGFTLASLYFIRDGFPDTIAPTAGTPANTSNVINFWKRQKASETIHEIKRWQTPFNLHVIPSIQAYIQKNLGSIDESPDSLFSLSVELEPRTPEQENMSRMFQESGFV